VRILGIDYGEKRCGLAISDPLGCTAQALPVAKVLCADELVTTIAKIVREKSVDEIVLGLPKNMDNSLGPSAQKVLEFQKQLESALGIPVHTWDERLSTVRAERAMLRADLSRKRRKRKRDTIAAQLILQSFLNYRSSLPGTGTAADPT